MKKSILIIEDSPQVQTIIEVSLQPFNLIFKSNLMAAKEYLHSGLQADLILLDIFLPDGDGLQFYKNFLKNEYKDIPVIVLTSNEEMDAKIDAFQLGAEDYITKPFDPMELRVRVEARMKKLYGKSGTQINPNELQIGDISLDVLKQQAWIIQDDKRSEVSLTSLEFRLLTTFSKSPDQVFSRERLLNTVWGSGTFISDRTIDTHVANLRKKINHAQTKIETIINEGYRIKLN